MILSSEYSIKRHIRKAHQSFNSNPSYKVIKGQCLERNKFFFKINFNTSYINSFRESSIESNILRSNSLLISALKEAKEVFKAKFLKKKEEYLNNLSKFKLDSKEKLSLF